MATTEKNKARRLVIVESPAKAKTIAGYLGDDFVVESSVGHIRDLPTRAADIPEKFKKEPWARLGVDVEHDFEPLYVVDPDKKKTVSELKKRLAGADDRALPRPRLRGRVERRPRARPAAERRGDPRVGEEGAVGAARRRHRARGAAATSRAPTSP